MKKFMRNCAILAGIMIVLGLGMTLTAAVVKGPSMVAGWRDSVPWDDLEDSVLSGLEGLDSGIRYELRDNIVFDSKYSILKGSSEQSFSADDVESLEIEMGVCEVIIEESEDEEFHVEVGNAGKYQGYVSGSTLYLRGMSKTGIGKKDKGCTIYLYVPKGHEFDKVELSMGAGEIGAETNLKVRNLEIELGAGDITLESVTVNTLDAEIGMGALELSGDIGKKAEVECAMGSVELELVGDETDYNYQLAAAAGEINIGNRSFGGMAGETYIDNNAAKEIDIECAMGSIDISFK
ncbi:MAG: DUF4097 domain-containing protein [Butyrivibrio sp.]|nr:DUF4097 domain-containing protein [Muribaculum sp.]MCM1552404.1 DUF4097 domain-containing protein [Butyrivibrio sp.]